MTDRLDRLERHLDEVLAGPRRLMRSLSKTTTGTHAVTDQPAYDFNKIRNYLLDAGYPIDGDAMLAVDAVEDAMAALTKAEAAPPAAALLAEVLAARDAYLSAVKAGGASSESCKNRSDTHYALFSALDKITPWPESAPAVPLAGVPDGCHVVRYNDDGEFGQKVGWLYRTGGDPCVISGKPVYVWRPIAELMETPA